MSPARNRLCSLMPSTALDLAGSDMLTYLSANVHEVDNYCHVFSEKVKQYSEFGRLPVHETAGWEMPAISWRFPFLIFVGRCLGSANAKLLPPNGLSQRIGHFQR